MSLVVLPTGIDGEASTSLVVDEITRMKRWVFTGLDSPVFKLGAINGGEPRHDPSACARCGAAGAVKLATVVPLHKGGRRVRANLRGLCAECLRIKRAEDR